MYVVSHLYWHSGLVIFIWHRNCFIYVTLIGLIWENFSPKRVCSCSDHFRGLDSNGCLRLSFHFLAIQGSLCLWQSSYRTQSQHSHALLCFHTLRLAPWHSWSYSSLKHDYIFSSFIFFHPERKNYKNSICYRQREKEREGLRLWFSWKSG